MYKKAIYEVLQVSRTCQLKLSSVSFFKLNNNRTIILQLLNARFMLNWVSFLLLHYANRAVQSRLWVRYNSRGARFAAVVSVADVLVGGEQPGRQSLHGLPRQR